MISGKYIDLRLLEDEEEVYILYSNFNDLMQRDSIDHLLIHQPNKKVKEFEENGLWTENGGTLCIVNKVNEFIGFINFRRKDSLTLEIGYRIFKRENRHHGYMTEALNLFSEYLFNTNLNITRLEIRTSVDNINSWKLAEKCGYQREGVLRKAYFYRGKICDSAIYSRLRR